MKLENQVLSINQVQELIELGFDVSKYASVEVNITEKGNKFIISKEFIKLFPKFGDNNVIKRYYSMTIGDIMEILPERIIGDKDTDEDIPYYIHVDKNEVYYYSHYEDYIFTISKINIIDALFETLKWCIANKHIAI